MLLEYAQKIAEKYKEKLSPFCERIEIAGSIRREKQRIGDIEIVCVPKRSQVDLFGHETAPCPGFIEVVNSIERVKGTPFGRYTQRLLLEECLKTGIERIKLDLFITTSQGWGYIFAIRTGSVDFSARVLANGWARKGYKGWGDHIENKRTGEKVYFPEEKDLFDFLGIDWVDPKERI